MTPSKVAKVNTKPETLGSILGKMVEGAAFGFFGALLVRLAPNLPKVPLSMQPAMGNSKDKATSIKDTGNKVEPIELKKGKDGVYE